MYNKGMQYNKLRENIPSNKFAYHLNHLAEEGIIEKKGDIYELTNEGVHLISSLDGVDIQEKKRPLVCTFVMGYEGEKILVHKRKKQPFMNYIGIPGGKIDFGGRLAQEAARELLEETGMKAGKLELKLITNFRTKDEETNQYSHHVIGFFFLATELSGELIKEEREGENMFITLNEAKQLERYPDFDTFANILLDDKPLQFLEADRFMRNGLFTGIEILE